MPNTPKPTLTVSMVDDLAKQSAEQKKDFELNRRRAERFVKDRLGAHSLMWEQPGPPDTAIAALQCWSLKSGRMAIVTIYRDGNGFDLYVNTLLQSLDNTVEVIRRLGEVEDAIHK